MSDNEIIKGLKRNTIDKFYTKVSIVNLCINYIKQYLKINKKDDLIIEPSAGNGAFISTIKTLSDNYKFYDIKPENSEIIKQDFLEFKYNEIRKKYKTIHLIGNPPFGRQSSLAIKFIKFACNFSDTISFILPKSFKKDSLKKVFPVNFHLIFEVDLPNNSFLANDVECDVPCVFQIWEKKNVVRIVPDVLKPLNFEFVDKIDDHDISFRRVGVNAGTISRKTTDMSEQSHYFIKFNNNKTVNYNLEKLKGLKFDFNNTVGPKSISKQELIKQFNILINEEEDEEDEEEVEDDEDEENEEEEEDEDEEDFLDEDEFNNYV
jgi:predicted RNA methylase